MLELIDCSMESHGEFPFPVRYERHGKKPRLCLTVNSRERTGILIVPTCKSMDTADAVTSLVYLVPATCFVFARQRFVAALFAAVAGASFLYHACDDYVADHSGYHCTMYGVGFEYDTLQFLDFFFAHATSAACVTAAADLSRVPRWAKDTAFLLYVCGLAYFAWVARLGFGIMVFSAVYVSCVVSTEIVTTFRTRVSPLSAVLCCIAVVDFEAGWRVQYGHSLWHCLGALAGTSLARDSVSEDVDGHARLEEG